MTSDALVKAILTEESCELYDRERIKNLFKNVKKGYGKLQVFKNNISITYTSGKSKKVIYNISIDILTPLQLDVVSKI